MSLIDIFRNKKILQLTHLDLDGVASVIIGKYYLQPLCKNFEYEICDRDFNIDEKKIKKADYILFTDITPTKDYYDNLIKMKKKVYLFDHHVSGKEELGAVDNYYYDLDKCGAKIFFDELSKNQQIKRIVNQFVELVDVRDRWKDKSALWKKASDLNSVLFGNINWFDKTQTNNDRYKFFIDYQIDKFNYNGRSNFFFTDLEKGMAEKGVIKEKNALEEARKSLRLRKDGEGNGYLYIECNSKLSYVSNILLNEYRDKIKYVVAYSTFNKEEDGTEISLRSNNDFDCSILARLHGGGGHKSASGIKLEHSFFKKLKNGDVHLL